MGSSTETGGTRWVSMAKIKPGSQIPELPAQRLAPFTVSGPESLGAYPLPTTLSEGKEDTLSEKQKKKRNSTNKA